MFGDKNMAPFGLPHIRLVWFLFQPEQYFSLTIIQPEQCFSASFSQNSDGRTGPAARQVALSEIILFTVTGIYGAFPRAFPSMGGRKCEAPIASPSNHDILLKTIR